MMGEQQGSSRSFLSLGDDDLEPRLPPRISRFPAPFDFPEKPVPQVPDVSLIFNMDMTAASSPMSAGNLSTGVTQAIAAGPIPIPNAIPRTPAESRDTSAGSIAMIGRDGSPGSGSPGGVGGKMMDLGKMILELEPIRKGMEEQKLAIQKIDEKLDKILEFVNQAAKGKNVVNAGMQTEQQYAMTPFFGKEKEGGYKVTPPLGSGGSGSSSTPSRTSTPAMPMMKKGPLARILREEGKGNNESLSAILPQLPSVCVNDPSALYSEASGIKSLDLQEFNDDSFNNGNGSGSDSPVLGASASAYQSGHGSDDEDGGNQQPMKPPTATFYNNVLGNVNRLLTGQGKKKDMEYRDLDYHQPSHHNRPSNKENQEPSSPHGSSSSSSSMQVQPHGQDQVVLNTRKYLESLGVEFGSPTPPLRGNTTALHRNNYMIQQNVYNSIYIPTVNCAPVVSEALDTGNATGSNFNSIAQKYVDHEELQCFEDFHQRASNNDQSHGSGGATGTDTTMYGMTPSNLSFSTKEYLQRYGLVSQPQPKKKQ